MKRRHFSRPLSILAVMWAVIGVTGNAWATTVVSGMSPEASRNAMPAHVLTVVHGRPDPLAQEFSEAGAELADFQPQPAPSHSEALPYRAPKLSEQAISSGETASLTVNVHELPDPEPGFQVAYTMESFEPAQGSTLPIPDSMNIVLSPEILASAVPEPTTLALVGLGALVLVRLRRRR